MTPGVERPWMLLAAGAYLAVVLAVGAWAARRTRSSKDFFIAGQGVGLLVTALATMSAGFSGFLFVGGPGLTYRLGTAAFLICFPVSFTAGMLCWVAARRLRLLAGVREVYTLPDALLARFGCRRTSGLGALAVLLGTVGYLGAQLLALGILMEEVVVQQVAPMRHLVGDAGLWPGLLLGAAVVLAYATAGGMVAGVYTDLVQGLLMIGAAVGVFFLALDVGGGAAGITRSIAASERFGASFLDPLGLAPWTAVSFFFVFAVGLLGQPHTLHKFFMLDDVRKLRWMPLVLGLSQTLVVLIWIAIGLVVPALVAEGRLPPLARPDDASPTFLLEFVPPALAGVVFAAVLAAIMSTADSFVNLAAAALVRDLPRAFGREPATKDGKGDDARELRHGRIAVVVVTLASALLAGFYGDLVGLLGTLAYGTFAAALAPVIAVGLGWRGCTARAASASIAVGLGLNLGLELAERAGWSPVPAGVLPSAPALAASFLVLLAVGLADGARGREQEVDDDVWSAVGSG